MKKKNIFILSLLLFLSITVSISAHPGSLDANGGHYNRKTGEYHYHEGLNTESDSSYNYEYTTYYSATTEKETTTLPSLDSDDNFTSENQTEEWDIISFLEKYIPTNIVTILCSVFLLCVLIYGIINFIVKPIDDFFDDIDSKTQQKIRTKKETEKKIIFEKSSALNEQLESLSKNCQEVKSQMAATLRNMLTDLYVIEGDFVENWGSSIEIIQNRIEKGELNKREVVKFFHEYRHRFAPLYYNLLFFGNFDNTSLNTLARVPLEYYFFGETLYKSTFGVLSPINMTVYITPTGNKYHSQKYCHGATIPMNILSNDYSLLSKQPCKDCFDPALSQLIVSGIPKWYKKYLDFSYLKSKYYIYVHEEIIHTNLINVSDDCVKDVFTNRQQILKDITLNGQPYPEVVLEPFLNSEGKSVFLLVTKYSFNHRGCIDLGEIKLKRSKQIYHNIDNNISVEISDITGLDKPYYLGCNIKIIIKW